mmetsp:Transcript_52988/g.105316  ORF Transcript_52988/g.105316 Transcript_52988/m.105316 type:complete len:237 (+) Transcript_52988:193-903(+)
MQMDCMVLQIAHVHHVCRCVHSQRCSSRLRFHPSFPEAHGPARGWACEGFVVSESYHAHGVPPAPAALFFLSAKRASKAALSALALSFFVALLALAARAPSIIACSAACAAYAYPLSRSSSASSSLAISSRTSDCSFCAAFRSSLTWLFVSCSVILACLARFPSSFKPLRTSSRSSEPPWSSSMLRNSASHSSSEALGTNSLTLARNSAPSIWPLPSRSHLVTSSPILMFFLTMAP